MNILLSLYTDLMPLVRPVIQPQGEDQARQLASLWGSFNLSAADFPRKTCIIIAST